MNDPRIKNAALLGILFPGLGHAYLGRRNKALFFGAIILALYVSGMALGAWRVVSWTHEPLWFLGEACAFGPTMLATLATSWLPWDCRAEHHHVALLYTTVAGLLNVVVAMDAFGIALADARGERS
jgi:Family of unknown function (DUF6677)